MTSHLHVDLDEAGGCYLVVKHAKGVEQKMLRVLTNSGLRKNVIGWQQVNFAQN